MINSIDILNFQPHRRLKVEFDPLATVFVGLNDRGKSSVLRAILWTSLNQPAGDEFMRHGASLTRVRLVVDGHTIERIRGKSNLYLLDGRKFRSFGTGVPAEIKKILKLEEDNFQSQFDPHFWLNLPPAQAAKALNDLAGLSGIDRAFSYINNRVRGARSRLEENNARMRRLRAEKGTLAWVPDAKDRLNRLISMKKEIEAMDKTIARLDEVIRKIEEAKRILAEVRPPSLRPIESIFSEVMDARRIHNRLSVLIQNIEELEETRCKIESQLESAKEELREISERICPTCGKPIG